MKLRSKISIFILILLVFSVSAFADDANQSDKPQNQKHSIFIGINPIAWVLSYYQAEVSIPISGVFEVAAQGSLLDVAGLAKTFGATTSSALYLAHFGGLLRIFPMQNASGFFFSGRVMALKFVSSDLGLDLWDLAAGVDLGWRFRWWLQGWGIIFQFYAGMERALTQQSIGSVLAVIPFFEFHLGVCF